MAWHSILDSGQLGIPNGIAQLDATGVLTSAQLPEVPPGSITGVLDPSQIPNLDASKITSGRLSTDRIPDLDARKITTGVIAGELIPQLPIGQILDLQTTLDRKALNFRLDSLLATVHDPPDRSLVPFEYMNRVHSFQETRSLRASTFIAVRFAPPV